MPQYNCPPLTTLLPEILSKLKEKFSEREVECIAEPCPNVSKPPFNLAVAQLGQLIYIVPDSVPLPEASRLIIAGKVIATANNFHIVSDTKAAQVLRIIVDSLELADLKTVLCEYFECKLGKNWEMLCIEAPNGSPKASVNLLRNFKSESSKLTANGELTIKKQNKITVLLAPIGRRIVSGTTRQSHSPSSSAAATNGSTIGDEKTKKKKIVKRIVKQPPSLSSVSSTSTLSSMNGTVGSTEKISATNELAINGCNENGTSSESGTSQKVNGIDKNSKSKNSGSNGIVGKMASMFNDSLSRRNSRDETANASASSTEKINGNSNTPKTNANQPNTLNGAKSTLTNGADLPGCTTEIPFTTTQTSTAAEPKSKVVPVISLPPKTPSKTNTPLTVTSTKTSNKNNSENNVDVPPRPTTSKPGPEIPKLKSDSFSENNLENSKKPVIEQITSSSDNVMNSSANLDKNSDDESSFRSALSSTTNFTIPSNHGKSENDVEEKFLECTRKPTLEYEIEVGKNTVNSPLVTNGNDNHTADKSSNNNNDNNNNNEKDTVIGTTISDKILPNDKENLQTKSIVHQLEQISAATSNASDKKTNVTEEDAEILDDPTLALKLQGRPGTLKLYTEQSNGILPDASLSTASSAKQSPFSPKKSILSREIEQKTSTTTLHASSGISKIDNDDARLTNSKLPTNADVEPGSPNSEAMSPTSLLSPTRTTFARPDRSTRSLPPIPASTSSTAVRHASRLSSLGVGNRRRILSPISSGGSATSTSLTEEDEEDLKGAEDEMTDEDETLLLSTATAPNGGDGNNRWSSRRVSEEDSEALGDFSYRDDFSNASELFAKTFCRPQTQQRDINTALPSMASKLSTTPSALLSSGNKNSGRLAANSTSPSVHKPKIEVSSSSEMVRGMMNQMPVVVLQQVLGHFSYDELCDLRRVHPHWDELCGQMLNSGYYQLIHMADRLLTDCQRRVFTEKYLAKPIQVLTNLQVHVINPVDVLRAAIDEGVICFPYGLILDKAFELLDRIEFVIRQNEEVDDALLNWERLAEFARRAQVHYRNIMEPEAERRMAEVYKLSAAQRLQRIDSFLVEASVTKLEKDTEKAKDDMRWEIEQLKVQNQNLKKDNRELKQTCLKLDSRIETLERKFKTMARLLQ